MEKKLEKNDVITIDINAITNKGVGVGKYDQMVVFVSGTAVGDRAEVIIIKVTRNYAVGKLKELIAPSPDRVENDCPAFPRCGGCVYRHISYDAELKIKQQNVADAFKHIGKLDVELQPIVYGDTFGYRNKAQYPVGNGTIGFYAPHSHRIVDCVDCALQPDIFKLAIEAVNQYIKLTQITIYDEESGRGVLRHIYLREAAATGQIMVCLVINGDDVKAPHLLTTFLRKKLGDRLKTVVLNINKSRSNVILGEECKTIYGDGYIYDVLCGVKVRLGALSFYQVNRDMAEKLYEKAAEFAGGGKMLLDLYCGAGTIGLSMADRFDEIVGVEVVKQAVADAKHNAHINGINNSHFICGDAQEIATQMSDADIHPDVVVVDPPRKGLADGLPRLIAHRFKPERVVYVSCDPATLARDCALFKAYGYSVEQAQAFDLFPRTSHVETVALITRK